MNGLGSVRSVVDALSAPLEIRHYDPYGNPFGGVGTAQTDFGFTGEVTDVNEQLYLRARYYAPLTGTFTALDPWEGTPQRPMSLNGYSWVEGNVVNKIDPTGLTDLITLAEAGLIALGLAGVAAVSYFAQNNGSLRGFQPANAVSAIVYDAAESLDMLSFIGAYGVNEAAQSADMLVQIAGVLGQQTLDNLLGLRNQTDEPMAPIPPPDFDWLKDLPDILDNLCHYLDGITNAFSNMDSGSVVRERINNRTDDNESRLVSHYTSNSDADQILLASVIQTSGREAHVYVFEGRSNATRAREAGAISVDARIVFDASNTELEIDPEQIMRRRGLVQGQLIPEARRFRRPGNVLLVGRNACKETPRQFGFGWTKCR